VLSSSRGSHSSTSLKSRVVHYSILAHATSATGQTRSFGDVSSMSGLPGSGQGWTIYEYTPPHVGMSPASAAEDL
jgi:hypothetical protein